MPVRENATFDSLIFDLDGTLWDSCAPVTRAWNSVASRIPGHTGIRSEDVISIMGLPHREIFLRLFPTLTDAEREQVARECYEEERKALLVERGRLYEGVEQGLSRLKAQYSLFLVSNCQSDYLNTFLKGSGVGHLFLDAECHGNTGQSKADNIRSIVKRNSLRAAAYIGDTASDQISAKRAGLDYFHMEYGFGDPESDCLRFASFALLTEFLMTIDD